MGILGDLNSSGLTAAQITHATEAVGQLPIETAGDLTHETDGRGGTSVIYSPGRNIEDVRLMAVVKVPGGKDFKDSRYVVTGQLPDAAGSSETASFTADGSEDDTYRIATNLDEWSDSTHYLQGGEKVIVFHLYTPDWGDFYVFSRTIPPVLVAVTGFTPTDDNGHYDTATITYGPGTGNACVVDNSNEAAWKVPGVVHKIHLLPVGWQGAGIIYGTTTDTPPKPKVRVSGQVGLDVLLTTDGGANSSTATGTATYTYTVKSHYGDTLLAGASPQWARPVGILTGPATKGYLQIDTGGNLMLAFTDEQAALTDCNDTGGG